MSINSQTSHSTSSISSQSSTGVKSSFLKYQRVNNPIVSEFISSIPTSFVDIVNRMLHMYAYSDSYTNDFILNNRIKLQKFIRKFHLDADTMTEGVSNKITLLSDPRTKLFVSIHQPNLFAYSGVFKKIVLLQAVKDLIEKQEDEKSPSKKIVNFFLIVDHDFIEDMWIRIAQLPSVKHSLGRLELRLPVSNSKRWQMVCNMPPPGRTTLDQWKKQIISWIKKNSSYAVSLQSNKLRLLDNFDQFWSEVELSYQKTRSYSDFNSFLMSQIVNKVWGYDTLFVRLTDISSVFEDGFKYLVSNFNPYSDALRKAEAMFLRHGIDTGVSSSSYLNAPVWVHCKCGSKAPVKIHDKQMLGRGGQEGQEIILKGICISCKNHVHVNIGKKHTMDLLKEEEVIHRLSPRAIPILLLLSRDLGITCYTSGTGGSMDYAVVGSMVFKELSINIPLTVIWSSKDIYYGIGQSEALELVQLTNQSDIVPYLESLKQKDAEYRNKIIPIIAERNHRIKSGESIHTVLKDLFNLKEEQRKIRRIIKMTQKVKNAVNMTPCFVDYAVNFGVANTEIQWRENLLNNNNLASPVVMKTTTAIKQQQ
jgi:hypothetical protein